jgi:hypothetical protein
MTDEAISPLHLASPDRISSTNEVPRRNTSSWFSERPSSPPES